MSAHNWSSCTAFNCDLEIVSDAAARRLTALSADNDRFRSSNWAPLNFGRLLTTIERASTRGSGGYLALSAIAASACESVLSVDDAIGNRRAAAMAIGSCLPSAVAIAP